MKVIKFRGIISLSRMNYVNHNQEVNKSYE